ncbi:DUF2933 domain-containing protein [Anaerobacillus isosaccharinicus]|uniref:DUF2933 domain-containing protein n=1 Tax=Anaerobacillus isosaccharinicus TaxID=1532552 RepID=A0A7S7L9I7_9BACI|nr:DUF2933 domain-containing protein [Anaerobacillus isosaccharinicus]QOY36870.1 DUF2933 domain-containing protein [Anaerobacillus isosaccharinicus]
MLFIQDYFCSTVAVSLPSGGLYKFILMLLISPFMHFFMHIGH